MIDEVMTHFDSVSKHDENTMTFDWTSLDKDKQNIFILAAFNPLSNSLRSAKLKIKSPGTVINNFKDANIDEILSKCGNTLALQQQLHVGYRSALPIAKLADFIKSHDYAKPGKIDGNIY